MEPTARGTSRAGLGPHARRAPSSRYDNRSQEGVFGNHLSGPSVRRRTDRSCPASAAPHHNEVILQWRFDTPHHSPPPPSPASAPPCAATSSPPTTPSTTRPARRSS